MSDRESRGAEAGGRSGRGAEESRLADDHARRKNWKRWGTYLSQRQWGTVREDYSADGEASKYFTHEDSRSRTYRWGEDGILGICDREQRLCFAPAFWNGRDEILKERLFGLVGSEGNHGEDVKECYFYLDALPTHSYAKALYKYPQDEFPYRKLLEENRLRGLLRPEYEILDTGVFDDDRYFDITVEYAKASPDDILIRYTIANRGPDAAVLHFLPTVWFRNTWSWGRTGYGYWPRPRLSQAREGLLQAEHQTLGKFLFAIETPPGREIPPAIFTDNETNNERLFGVPNDVPFVKDAFHDYVIGGRKNAVNPRRTGTKAAFHLVLEVPARGEAVVRLRLFEAPGEREEKLFGDAFDRIFAERIRETDTFYAERIPQRLGEPQRRVARQAYAGLLWTKQFYHYIVQHWLEGDPSKPKPPASRWQGRNSDWTHVWSRDVISMPDSWEYPWFALWDLSFQMIPFARIDPAFAKEQLVLLLREWYMHPNGEEPAYEFNFGDVNPPVHAWAGSRIYAIANGSERRDRDFLARIFQEHLFDFTWWLNRKDPRGNHIFSGGFLGLDNIGIFDRSHPSPDIERIDEADATAWMAFYCATMLSIALELAQHDAAYEDTASKFFEHFIDIADAINTIGGGLWDEEDGFYYDKIHTGERTDTVRVRSVIGIIPLFAVELIEDDMIKRLPGFTKRMNWFLQNRNDVVKQISCLETKLGPGGRYRMLAITSRERLVRVLRHVLDEGEFLSPYGIRSLSKFYGEHPYVFHVDGEEKRISYAPGESDSGLFGGNSNWRGPVWFPINFLLIEALKRYHVAYGGELRVECPTGSGKMMTLAEVAREITRRLLRIYEPGRDGSPAPVFGGDRRFAEDPNWRDLLWFFECFHGETGRGVGASHQTGWTSLIVKLLEESASD